MRRAGAANPSVVSSTSASRRVLSGWYERTNGGNACAASACGLSRTLVPTARSTTGLRHPYVAALGIEELDSPVARGGATSSRDSSPRSPGEVGSTCSKRTPFPSRARRQLQAPSRRGSAGAARSEGTPVHDLDRARCGVDGDGGRIWSAGPEARQWESDRRPRSSCGCRRRTRPRVRSRADRGQPRGSESASRWVSARASRGRCSGRGCRGRRRGSRSCGSGRWGRGRRRGSRGCRSGR